MNRKELCDRVGVGLLGLCYLVNRRIPSELSTAAALLPFGRPGPLVRLFRDIIAALARVGAWLGKGVVYLLPSTNL